jgi:hypothetical protein
MKSPVKRHKLAKNKNKNVLYRAQKEAVTDVPFSLLFHCNP